MQAQTFLAIDDFSLWMTEQHSHMFQITIDDESHLGQITERVEYSKKLKDDEMFCCGLK